MGTESYRINVDYFQLNTFGELHFFLLKTGRKFINLNPLTLKCFCRIYGGTGSTHQVNHGRVIFSKNAGKVVILCYLYISQTPTIPQYTLLMLG